MTLTLSAGGYTLGLDPQTGGAIATFLWRGIQLLRPVRDDRLAAQHGASVAGYPLFPYANRIGDARFQLDGEDFTLARNFGDSPHSIHGNAWMRPWTVEASAPDAAELVLRHLPPADPPEQWPFAYEARQGFRLSAAGLSVDLSLRNLDSRPWPAGIGLHPYVSRTPHAMLAFHATGLWRTGADELPAGHVTLPEDMDFAQPREIGGAAIDACFTGWNGETRVAWPEDGTSLSISGGGMLRFFQVYTPPGKAYCGLEPVSNMPDAIHHLLDGADNGLTWLAPGETLRGTIRFAVMEV